MVKDLCSRCTKGFYLYQGAQGFLCSGCNNFRNTFCTSPDSLCNSGSSRAGQGSSWKKHLLCAHIPTGEAQAGLPGSVPTQPNLFMPWRLFSPIMTPEHQLQLGWALPSCLKRASGSPCPGTTLTPAPASLCSRSRGSESDNLDLQGKLKGCLLSHVTRHTGTRPEERKGVWRTTDHPVMIEGCPAIR